jgi:hypothetical protein
LYFWSSWARCAADFKKRNWANISVNRCKSTWGGRLSCFQSAINLFVSSLMFLGDEVTVGWTTSGCWFLGDFYSVSLV